MLVQISNNFFYTNRDLLGDSKTGEVLVKTLVSLAITVFYATCAKLGYFQFSYFFKLYCKYILLRIKKNQ